jgi:hypothetical protein
MKRHLTGILYIILTGSPEILSAPPDKRKCQLKSAVAQSLEGSKPARYVLEIYEQRLGFHIRVI